MTNDLSHSLLPGEGMASLSGGDRSPETNAEAQQPSSNTFLPTKDCSQGLLPLIVLLLVGQGAGCTVCCAPFDDCSPVAECGNCDPCVRVGSPLSDPHLGEPHVVVGTHSGPIPWGTGVPPAPEGAGGTRPGGLPEPTPLEDTLDSGLSPSGDDQFGEDELDDQFGEDEFRDDRIGSDQAGSQPADRQAFGGSGAEGHLAPVDSAPLDLIPLEPRRWQSPNPGRARPGPSRPDGPFLPVGPSISRDQET